MYEFMKIISIIDFLKIYFSMFINFTYNKKTTQMVYIKLFMLIVFVF